MLCSSFAQSVQHNGPPARNTRTNSFLASNFMSNHSRFMPDDTSLATLAHFSYFLITSGPFNTTSGTAKFVLSLVSWFPTAGLEALQCEILSFYSFVTFLWMKLAPKQSRAGSLYMAILKASVTLMIKSHHLAGKSERDSGQEYGNVLAWRPLSAAASLNKVILLFVSCRWAFQNVPLVFSGRCVYS